MLAALSSSVGQDERVTLFLSRHQVLLYLAAIVVAVVVGLLVPAARALDVLVTPVLALLLLATFLAVPFRMLGRAARDIRFVSVLGVLNFVVVPAVVFGLSRFVAADDALLVGVLLVLLTPCVDYVIVFAALAGGASDRLLAAAPLLMLAQLLLLPLYLLAFAGPEAVSVIEPGPFVEAFVWLILVPLIVAAIVQWLAGSGQSASVQTGAVDAGKSADASVSASAAEVVSVRAPRRRQSFARGILSVFEAAMVPLMMLTLFVVVASQIGPVAANLGRLAGLIPLYAAFVVVMVPLGCLAARLAKLDVPSARALTFSGVTRNSLVVLPLALALPAAFDLAPLAVVTQTLVELVAMVVLVRLVPRLVRARPIMAP
jgi:ACR3 family arsenite efflux pump ArsB